MIRRKFMQLVLVASSSSALAFVGTTAHASGGESGNDGGASRGGQNEANENHSGGASVGGNSGANENHSGGASIGDNSGANENHSGGASIGGHDETNENYTAGGTPSSTGGSIYCSTNSSGQQNCGQETYDGLTTVTGSDLDDVLQSFN